jgi:hypothetical protein
VRCVGSRLITHDDLQFPEPRFNIPTFFLNHDRLKRRNFWNLDGGVGFAITDSLDGFAAVVGTLRGENVHPIRGITGGVSWHVRASGDGVVASSSPSRNVRAVAPPPHVPPR